MDEIRDQLREAFRDAGLSQASVHAIRVLTTEAFTAEVSNPPGADLMGFTEIGALLGVSRQRAAQLATERPDFPPPIARLAMGPVYTRQSIDAFAARWNPHPGRPSKNRTAS